MAMTPGEVQVWHFALDVGADARLALERLLDAEERDRADRFRFEEHRRRFIARRGILRIILSRYLHTAPEAIRFASGASGKPSVISPHCALHFSASSSQDLGAVAVSGEGEVGLDVEQVRSDRDHDLIARDFAEEEAAALRRLAPEARVATFFDLWTCKEAYLKGKGLGLGAPLNKFAVAIDAAPVHLAWSALDAADPGRWSLHRMPFQPGFAACLAVAGGCGSIRCDRFVW